MPKLVVSVGSYKRYIGHESHLVSKLVAVASIIGGLSDLLLLHELPRSGVPLKQIRCSAIAVAGIALVVGAHEEGGTGESHAVLRTIRVSAGASVTPAGIRQSVDMTTLLGRLSR